MKAILPGSLVVAADRARARESRKGRWRELFLKSFIKEFVEVILVFAMKAWAFSGLAEVFDVDR
jgi:hypothetical protein